NLAWAGQLKHVITVGAILGFPAGRYAGATSVVSTSTSSWGPAFDGRIKPDLVAVSRSADGAGLRTPTGPESDAYGHISGTSAAAPVVTGGLALLVEHARRRLDIGTFRASTWKALLLHTAREAGPHGGPDYRFGYGLFDASAAVRVIDEVAEGQGMIRAVELADGDTLWLDVDGGPIVRATGAWTDPYASTFDLVHDMDLRIVDADGTEHLPWTLNPQEPTAPALKADNSRDVVEQVIVENGVPPYRLRITHKGRLRSPQWISLVVSSPSRPAKNKRSLQQK
ncbi:MAG: S8 family serine peptidase, partial [Bacteroidota bacterium]